MKQKIILFLKLTIFVIGAVVLALCVFWLPEMARIAALENPEYAHLRFTVLLGLYITTIPFFFALQQSSQLLNHIKGESAFSEFALKALVNIKRCASVIIAFYIIGSLYLLSQNALHPGIALIGFVIIFVSLVISVFAAGLEDLLKKVLVLKMENDLTI